MSNLNIANLPRISSTTLRLYLLNPATAPPLAIIDVRDTDHAGGHIHSSTHLPVSEHATHLPELARTLQPKQLVVFHCMLCQQRGPKAALEYARTRERLLGPEKGRCFTDKEVRIWEPGLEIEGSAVGTDERTGTGQVVAVLDGGFYAWRQAGYGEDERLTEGYDKELWESIEYEY